MNSMVAILFQMGLQLKKQFYVLYLKCFKK